MYLYTLAGRYADGHKKPLAIILMSVNDRQYWLLHTVALRRPIPGLSSARITLQSSPILGQVDSTIILCVCSQSPCSQIFGTIFEPNKK